MSTIKQFASQVVVNQILDYVKKDPMKNLGKITALAKKVTKNDRDLRVIKGIEEAQKDENNPWIKLLDTFFKNTNKKVQQKFFQNFLLNSVVYGIPKKAELARKHNLKNIPWTILLDPTSKCNLKCKGCWAAEYNKSDDLDFDTLDRIIAEGKELGIYVYIYSGGEPTIRINDLIKLAEKHEDCFFTCFTNGTLITENVAKELARIGNFAPAFSIEGFEEATDFRRGNKTFERAINGMENLKNEGVMFGVSGCYHHYNYKDIGSEEFIDYIIDLGSYFMWLFTYMPIGKDADVDLCCRPNEREYMYHAIREFRKSKPLFTMDFWNDGEYVNGCIAGGKNYFHINANGDVEPCAFVHFSDTNIKDVSVLDALKSPLFKAYQEHQPFNCNHLRPCPILDNPEKISEMVNATDAISTQPLDKEAASELTKKCTPIAAKWAENADKLWYNSDKYKNNTCTKCKEETACTTK